MMRAMRICNFLYFLSAAALLTLAACGTTSTSKPETPAKPALIPMPVNVEPTPGYFELRDGATLNVQATNAEAAGVSVDFLIDFLDALSDAGAFQGGNYRSGRVHGARHANSNRSR